MKERFLQNLDLLKKNHVNVDEHDACGVGFVVSMNGKPKREVILNGTTMANYPAGDFTEAISFCKDQRG